MDELHMDVFHMIASHTGLFHMDEQPIIPLEHFLGILWFEFEKPIDFHK